MAIPFEEPQARTAEKHWKNWTARPKGRQLQINNVLSAVVLMASTVVMLMQHGV